MAKLLAYHTLPQISDQFLGLARDAQDDRIICTYGRNLILIIELSTQKQVRSWSPEEKLLKRVVYDSQTEQYVGLFGERNIKCWSEETSNISKVKRTKLLRPVHEFVVLDDGRLLVLYSSSYCESLKSAIETIKAKNEINEPNRPEVTLREVSQAKVITGHNGKLVFSFFTKKMDDGEVLLSFVELDEEKLQPLRGYTRIRVTSASLAGQKLAACTLIESTQGMELVSIWNDNSIFLRHLDFNIDAEEPDSVGHFVTNLSVINPNEKMTMIALRSDCVAIYAANSAQDGASVLLYNTQFKVVQSRQSFKVFFPQSKMFLVQSNLFLMAGQNFAMIPFRLTKNKLSNLIGSQRNPDIFDNTVDREVINEHGDLEEALTFTESPSATSCQTEDGVTFYSRDKKRTLRNQFATRTFEDPEEIDEKLVALYRYDLEVEIVENKFLPPGRVSVRTLQNPKDTSQMKLQMEILTAQLERSGAGEIEITEKILPLLIEAELTSDIIIALRRYLLVSEKMITRVLKYALSLPNDSDSDSTDLLNIILSCSFHTATITPYLRSDLTLCDTLTLLKHLHMLYLSPDMKLEERPDNGTYHNDDKQIMEWVSVLIDSHYQQICISKDEEVLTVVRDWKKIIKTNVEAMKELNTLRATLLKFAEGQDLTATKQACRFYSVERLKIY